MRIRAWAAGAVLTSWLALTGGAAQADVLTFDGAICTSLSGVCTNSSAIRQSYGDTALVDVTGDPNVNSTAGDNLLFWADDYSDLQNVAWGASGATAGIFITPIAGYRVTLNGFDLGSYPRTTRTSQWWVYDSFGQLLGSSGGAISVGTTATHVAGAFVSQNGIAIHWGPDAFNVGIDNVDFTVSAITTAGVPEPGAWALMILGFGAAGAAMRRRRAMALAA